MSVQYVKNLNKLTDSPAINTIFSRRSLFEIEQRDRDEENNVPEETNQDQSNLRMENNISDD